MRPLLNSLWFRLLLGFAVPLVLFLGAACVSFFSIQGLLNSLVHEQVSQEILTRISEVKESLEGMAAAQRAHHLLGKDEFRNNFYERRRIFLQDLSELHTLLERNPEQLNRLDRIKALESEWFSLSEKSFQLWRKSPTGDGLSSFKDTSKLNLEQSISVLNNIAALTDAMVSTETEQLQKYRRDVQERTHESVWAIVAALLVSVGFSMGITQLLWRSISRPIQRLRAAVHTMRQGRYEAVAPFGPTEIVELIRGFNLMGLALAERTSLLENSERRYRTVVGTTSNLIWTTDPAGCNTEMANWCVLTGQKPEQAADDGWLEAIHPDDRERFGCHWKQVLKDKIYAEDEVRIRRADGQYRCFNCRSVPIFDAKDAVVEWVRICVDITERRREEELRREKEAAEAANRAKSEFLTKMSHELRTPLNAIIGMSKMLRTRRFGELNDKQLDYLTDITQAGTHLLSLINDILDLSRVETGRLELNPEPLPVQATIDQVVSSVRPLVEQKSLQLHTETCTIDEVITADAARFKQVLYNLLSNAVKFTPAGGRVDVRCRWVTAPAVGAAETSRERAGAIRIDVADTGIGIAAEDQALLGKEFFQPRRNSNKAPDGTGLGLALSRRLVEMMDGQLWFTSTLGQGSTFSFTLPLKPAEAATPAIRTAS